MIVGDGVVYDHRVTHDVGICPHSVAEGGFWSVSGVVDRPHRHLTSARTDATPDGHRKTPEDWSRRPVTISTGATIGAAAVIAPGITVGAHALVGLGAIVLRDVPAHALIIGNPARQIGWVWRCARTLGPQLRCPACSRS